MMRPGVPQYGTTPAPPGAANSGPPPGPPGGGWGGPPPPGPPSGGPPPSQSPPGQGGWGGGPPPPSNGGFSPRGGGSFHGPGGGGAPPPPQNQWGGGGGGGAPPPHQQHHQQQQPGGYGGPAAAGKMGAPVVSAQQLLQQNPQKAGYMIKQGGGIRSWQKRFFILSGDKLYYFEKDSSPIVKGIVTIDSRCAVSNTYVDGKPNCIAVKTPEKTYNLSCVSVDEAEDWIRQLSQTMHGATSTSAPPLVPLARKKSEMKKIQEGKLNDHVLLTLRCLENQKGQQASDVKELCKVADNYINLAIQQAEAGQQMCNAMLRVASGTQNYDVGDSLSESAQLLKQSFINQQEENKFLKFQVVAAMHKGGEGALNQVRAFERTQKKELQRANAMVKKAEQQFRRRGNEDTQAALEGAIHKRDHARENLLREALLIERGKYRSILELWSKFEKTLVEHRREEVAALDEALPRFERFTTPDFISTLPENVEDLIHGKTPERLVSPRHGPSDTSRDSSQSSKSASLLARASQYDDAWTESTQTMRGGALPPALPGAGAADNDPWANPDAGDAWDDSSTTDAAAPPFSAPPPPPAPPGTGGGGGGGGAPSVLFTAVALWDSTAEADEELGFAKGEILSIFDDSDADWWEARNASGQEGKIPASYVQRE